MNQLSIEFQAGAEGFSEIIFFQDKRSFNEFTAAAEGPHPDLAPGQVPGRREKQCPSGV